MLLRRARASSAAISLSAGMTPGRGEGAIDVFMLGIDHDERGFGEPGRRCGDAGHFEQGLWRHCSHPEITNTGERGSPVF